MPRVHRCTACPATHGPNALARCRALPDAFIRAHTRKATACCIWSSTRPCACACLLPDAIMHTPCLPSLVMLQSLPSSAGRRWRRCPGRWCTSSAACTRRCAPAAAAACCCRCCWRRRRCCWRCICRCKPAAAPAAAAPVSGQPWCRPLLPPHPLRQVAHHFGPEIARRTGRGSPAPVAERVPVPVRARRTA